MPALWIYALSADVIATKGVANRRCVIDAGADRHTCMPAESNTEVTCDDNIKVLQPVLVPGRSHTPRQQEVHDHMSVVPKRVGGHKQLLASSSVHLHDPRQALVLVYVLGWVFGHCLFQAAISVAEVHCSTHVPASVATASQTIAAQVGHRAKLQELRL